jgi:hypothetical protein
MAGESNRVAMVAVSNAVTGIGMRDSEVVDVAAIWFVMAGVINMLALISLIPALYTVRLPEVLE